MKTDLFQYVATAEFSKFAGSRWVIIPSCLSGSWRSFLYSSSVYSYPLFLISSTSVRPILLLSFIVPIFAWNVPLVSLIFLKRSLVFPILLFYPIYLHCLFKKSFLSLLPNTLHSDGYIFPFLFCLLLLFCHFFFKTSENLFAFLFLGYGLGHCLLSKVMNLYPYFFRNFIRSNPFNQFVTSTL